MKRIRAAIFSATLALLMATVTASAQGTGYAPENEPTAPIVIHGSLEIKPALDEQIEAIEDEAATTEEIAEAEPTIDEIVHVEATK